MGRRKGALENLAGLIGMNETLGFYQGKRVFITGHTGFKGSWLCRALLNAGAAITGYALEPDTEPALFDILSLKKDMDSIIGDIRDFEKLNKAIKKSDPEIVFHMAAQPIVREGYDKPVYTYEVNVMGTVNLLEAARGAKGLVSLVNITTDKVYENKEQADGYIETDTLCGSDPYSNSKSCSELVTYAYKKSFYSADGSPAVSTARSGNVIGGGDFAPFRIIPDCVRASLAGEPITIRNPKSIRPYQHVLDCLSGYLRLAQAQAENAALAGHYNFGPADSDSVTTENLVKIFCSAWGGGASYDIKPDGGPPETNFLKLDVRKSKAILGWAPAWDINKAVEKTAAWEKARECDEASGETDAQIAEFFGCEMPGKSA